MGRKRQRAVRIGIPVLVVGGLTFVALWQVTSRPPAARTAAAPAPGGAPLPPLTQAADVISGAAVGRRASRENVPILAMPSARSLWIAADTDRRVMAVLDPDVKRSHEARVAAGARVTLIGLVRPAPSADVAVRQWSIDAETARFVEQAGAYLYVTEIRPAS
jgi:hypothetical protein